MLWGSMTVFIRLF